MELRRLGRTDLDVSVVSLGTAELSGAYGIVGDGRHLPPSDEEAALLLNGAIDRGINFLDTARLYGPSEKTIGRTLQGRRAEVVLATKVHVSDVGEARSQIDRAVETSLRCLRTDWIDLLYLHNATTSQLQDQEVREALVKQKETGKVRHVGATIYSHEEGSVAVDSDLFEVIQFPYNILAADSWIGFLNSAGRARIGLVARSVLLKGVLTPRSAHLPVSLRRLDQTVGELCDAFSITREELPKLAIRFALSSASVSSAVIGAARFQEMVIAAEAAALGPLSPHDMNKLKSIDVPQDLLDPSGWPEDVL